MPNNIKGVGAVFQRDGETLNVIRASTFSATEDKQFDEVKAYPVFDCGVMSDVDIAEKESSMTVTVGSSSLDEQAISFLLFNNKFKTTNSIFLPEYKRGVILNGAIADADLSVDQNVQVTVVQDVTPGNIPLTRQAVGTGVTATAFEVNLGQLEFDSSLEGKTVAYRYAKEYTNIRTIGGEYYDPYSNVEIAGKICGTRFNPMKIWFPSCTSLSGMSLDPSADNFDREYKALVPTELGFVVPYITWGFAV